MVGVPWPSSSVMPAKAAPGSASVVIVAIRVNVSLRLASETTKRVKALSASERGSAATVFGFPLTRLPCRLKDRLKSTVLLCGTERTEVLHGS